MDEPEPREAEKPPARPATDTRALRRGEERRLFLAVIAFLLVVGGGLIFIIYGKGALVTAAACLLMGVGVLLILWLILIAIERWANR
jgi:hypothetical protein